MQDGSLGSLGRVAFRYPSFRRYMSARVLTVAASEMQAVAVAWQVYALTHRPLDLGLVGLAQFLPGIVLFLAAGHAADRFRRRRVLEACNVSFALCSLLLLALTVNGIRSVVPIYLALLLNGAVRAFHGPAGQAFLPLLVPELHFPNAVAWSASIFQAATILGPVVGGAVYGWTGSAAPVYAASALANVAAWLLVGGIRERTAATAPAGRPPSLKTALEGLRYIRENKLLLGVISLDLFAVLLGGAVALLPVYAREILNVGASGLGLLRSAPGLGAVAIAVVVAHWPLRRRAGTAMLWCVAGYGVATIVFGLSRNMALALAALALTGALDMVSVIVRHTLIQLATPNEMRGRVSAVNMVFIGASNEVGQFESGVTAQWLGAAPAVILGGAGAIAVVAIWAYLFPALRRARIAEPRSEGAVAE